MSRAESIVAAPGAHEFGSSGTTFLGGAPGDPKEGVPAVAPRWRRRQPPPAGKNIVKGTPSWVHFGDGKDEIDMQLTPGRHRLALQLGDDLHNTVPGACQMITVTVK
jgi:hypothetical protein